jgi:hypothetical protein
MNARAEKWCPDNLLLKGEAAHTEPGWVGVGAAIRCPVYG